MAAKRRAWGPSPGRSCVASFVTGFACDAVETFAGHAYLLCEAVHGWCSAGVALASRAVPDDEDASDQFVAGHVLVTALAASSRMSVLVISSIVPARMRRWRRALRIATLGLNRKGLKL